MKRSYVRHGKYTLLGGAAIICILSILVELTFDSTSSFIRLYSPSNDAEQIGIGSYLKTQMEHGKRDASTKGKSPSNFSCASHSAAFDPGTTTEPVLSVTFLKDFAVSRPHDTEKFVPIRPPIS